MLRRRPRPSCCRNRVGLSVGRSIRSVSTAGTSTPSLKRSTENTTLTRLDARSAKATRRSESGVSDQIAVAATPAARNTRAIKRACSTLTQKPSARMRARSSMRCSSSFRTNFARCIIGSQEVGKAFDIVAAPASPRDVAQVEAIVDSVVNESHQPLLIDRIPEAKLGRNAPFEPFEDRQSIASLRCRGKPKQLNRPHVVKQHSVRLSCRMMKLIDDYNIEMCRIQVCKSRGVEALDRCEDVLELLGPVAAYPKLAKQRVTKRLLERGTALRQDLFAVRHKQKSCTRKCFAQPQIIKGGHHGLPGTGCRH